MLIFINEETSDLGTCTWAVSQERTGPGKGPQKSQGKRKREWSGWAGPSNEVASEQRQKAARAGQAEGVSRQRESQRGHTVIWFCPPVGPPNSTHTAQGSAQEGLGTRCRPPAPLHARDTGQASLLEVLTSGLAPRTSAPSLPRF